MTLWNEFSSHYEATRARAIVDLVKDPARLDDFTVQTNDLYFDFSKTKIRYWGSPALRRSWLCVGQA